MQSTVEGITGEIELVPIGLAGQYLVHMVALWQLATELGRIDIQRGTGELLHDDYISKRKVLSDLRAQVIAEFESNLPPFKWQEV